MKVKIETWVELVRAVTVLVAVLLVGVVLLVLATSSLDVLINAFKQ